MLDVMLPLIICVPDGLSVLVLAQGMPNVCTGVADDPVEWFRVKAALLHSQPNCEAHNQKHP